MFVLNSNWNSFTQGCVKRSDTCDLFGAVIKNPVETEGYPNRKTIIVENAMLEAATVQNHSDTMDDRNV